MRGVWLIHRALLIALVIAGLAALAQATAVGAVAAGVFLLFATAPVAGWTRSR